MTLPVSLAAIPGVEQIGEPVIAETGDLMNARQADQPRRASRRPAWRAKWRSRSRRRRCSRPSASTPCSRRRTSADGGAEAGQRIGLQIDVAEFDSPGAGRAHQPVALPVDAGVTDRAFGIVPDRELRTHWRRFVIDRGSGYNTPCSTSHPQVASHDRRRRHRSRTLGQIHRRGGAGQEQTPALHSRREQRARARRRFRQDPRFRAGHGIFRRGRRSARAGGVFGDAAFAARRADRRGGGGGQAGVVREAAGADARAKPSAPSPR